MVHPVTSTLFIVSYASFPIQYTVLCDTCSEAFGDTEVLASDVTPRGAPRVLTLGGFAFVGSGFVSGIFGTTYTGTCSGSLSRGVVTRGSVCSWDGTGGVGKGASGAIGMGDSGSCSGTCGRDWMVGSLCVQDGTIGANARTCNRAKITPLMVIQKGTYFVK